MPITKGIFQAFIEHLSAHLQHQMGTLLRPLHLLLFRKPLAYDLIYRRFNVIPGRPKLRLPFLWSTPG
jgi:hypothetical protein